MDISGIASSLDGHQCDVENDEGSRHGRRSIFRSDGALESEH